MATTIKFTKMQGTGNDYIYVNTLSSPLQDPIKAARKWSAYHTGIGADGLVLIGASEKADFSMRIFNADGSEAMMCGNASRCIGKYVYEKGLTDKEVITLETLSGIKIHETSYRQRGGEGCNRRYRYAPAIKPRTDSYENRWNAGRNYPGRWKRIQRNIRLHGKSACCHFRR